MTRKIRLVAVDLDGTLLDPEKRISEQTADAIKASCRAGELQFTFITGRPLYAVERFARQMEITAPIVACNGALICRGGEILARRSLELEALKDLMHRADAAGCTVLYYADGVECAMRDTEWVHIRQAQGRDYPVQDPFVRQPPVLRAEKINIMAQEASAGFASLLPFLEKLRDSFEIVCYGDQGCEIAAKGVNKAAGLRELAGILGLSMEEIMAVGDNENDREMLLEAGCGAAVANATESAKNAADYLCRNAYTEGVLEAVRLAAEGGRR